MAARKEVRKRDLDHDSEDELSPPHSAKKLRKNPTVLLSDVSTTNKPTGSSFRMVLRKGSSFSDLDLSLSKKPTSFMNCEEHLGREPSDMDLDLNIRTEALRMESDMSIKRKASSMDFQRVTRRQTSTMEFDTSNLAVNIKKEPSCDTDMITDSLGTEASMMRCDTMLVTGAMKGTPSVQMSDLREGDSFMDTNMSQQMTTFSTKMSISAEGGPSSMESKVRVKSEPGMHRDYFSGCEVEPMSSSNTVLKKLKSEPQGESDPEASLMSRLTVKWKRKKKVSPQVPKRAKRIKLKTNEESDGGVIVKCEPVSADSSYTNFVCGKASRLKEGSTRANEIVSHPKRKKRKRKGPAQILCPLCELHFCSRSSLKRHFKRKHATENFSQVPFTCKECGEDFPRQIQLRAHEQKHRGGEKTFPCQECETVFTRAAHLRVHMRKHTGERPYSCQDCGTTFRSMSNLNRHKAKHSGLRPFVCTVCNADFYQSSHLVSHIRKHTGERPFACSECKATFTQLTHLHRHMAKHTGKKPYQCSECNRAFVEKCGLTRHMQIHVPKRARTGRIVGKGRNEKKKVEAQKSSRLVTKMSCS